MNAVPPGLRTRTTAIGFPATARPLGNSKRHLVGAMPPEIATDLPATGPDKIRYMTALDLIAFEADNVGYQLEQVFANLPAPLRDDRLVESAMSPNETLEHLTECYQAAIEASKGKEYEWGIFKMEEQDWDARFAAWRKARADALQALLHDDQEKLKACSSYITSHDAYHVGQIALFRISRDSDWDSYSIYRE